MPDSIRRLGVLVLAAGASTRLGRAKQLLPWRGRSLLRHITETALSARPDGGDLSVVVVLGAEPERFRPELDGLPVKIAVNDDWTEGQVSSLRAGIATMEMDSEPVDAALVLLCDQPLVTPETLHRLLNAFAESETCVAAASIYGTGGSGPPILFARSLFPELQALRGEQRAKDILSKLPPGAVARVLCPEGARDIDTAEDWERLSREQVSETPA